MNPLQMIQGVKNPQQFLQQIMGNNQMMQNPMIKNTVQMAQNGDAKGIEQLARNLCKEKGINADDMFNQMKNNFGM